MKEIEQIWADLQWELAALDNEKNTIRRLELSRSATAKAVEKLEEVFNNSILYSDDPLALSNFNCKLAPPFYAKFIFFSKVLAFECLKADTDPRDWERLYDAELAYVRFFFKQHSPFRRYYLRGVSVYDTHYFHNFVRNAKELVELVVGISPDVNEGCLLVAYMKAFDDYTDYLTTAMQKGEKEPAIVSDLHWKGDVSDLNDLLIILELEARIYKGDRKATIREIMEAFGPFLHVNLANSAQLDNKRRNTVKEGPSFLDILADASKKRKRKLDDNQNGRKRRG